MGGRHGTQRSRFVLCFIPRFTLAPPWTANNPITWPNREECSHELDLTNRLISIQGIYSTVQKLGSLFLFCFLFPTRSSVLKYLLSPLHRCSSRILLIYLIALPFRNFSYPPIPKLLFLKFFYSTVFSSDYLWIHFYSSFWMISLDDQSLIIVGKFSIWSENNFLHRSRK